MGTTPGSSAIPVVLADMSSRMLGSQRQTLALARALAASEVFSPLVAAPDNAPLLLAAEAEGLPVLSLRCDGPFQIRAKNALKKTLRQAAPCIAHSQDRNAAALLTGLDGVIHIHTKRDAQPVPAGRKGNCLRSARVVVALSSSMGAMLTAGGVEGARIRIIPSSIDADACSKRQSRGDGRFIFTVTGELTPENGHDVLLHALPFLHRFPDMPDWEVRFTGQGDLFHPLLDLALTLGVKGRLAFLGSQDRNSVLPDCNAIVAPAIADAINGEDNGDPLREGWAADLPVIASNLLSHCEMARNGENALIYPMDDPETLALHMANLARDGKLREKLVSGGARSLRPCSVSDMAAAYMNLYLTFLTPGRRER